MSDLRIGDADRDRAAAALGDHFAQGRLSAEEHAERLDAIWTARTEADLAVLFEDLPSERALAARSGRLHHRHRGPRLLVPILVAMVVLTVLTHLPLFLLAVGVFVFVGMRRAAGRGGVGRRAAWLS